MFIAFLKISALHFLGLISPGPDFAMVVRNAMLYERKVALATALGIALGISVHVSYALLGLSLLIIHIPWLFHAIKYAGAAYLTYIGIKALLSKDDSAAASNHVSRKSIPVFASLKQGFFCNVLNPKAGLFILGLFTLAVGSDTSVWEKIFYGFWMMLTTWLWFSAVVFLIHQPYFRSRLLYFQKYITKGMGVLLIIFGIQLFFYTLY